MKVKEESEKVGLKLNIQKTKIMASGPITSCEIDGEILETVSDFILWGSKITADGDCSHEIKRRLLLGRKVMTNLDSIFKSRDRSCLYIFEISCLSVASFAIIFSHLEGCLFTLPIFSFVVQKLLILIRSHLFIFAFISRILGGGS